MTGTTRDGAPVSGAVPILDRGHLRRQAMDDPALEAELLGLLLIQIEALEPALRPADATARAAIGHRVAGGARSLGAFRLAEAARDLALDGASEALAERLLAEARHLARLLRDGEGTALVD